MPRTKLYQCPYDEHTKCSLADPCLDCEEFAANIKEARFTVRRVRPRNKLKAEILPLVESIRICIKERKYQYALNRVDDIVAKLSAV